MRRLFWGVTLAIMPLVGHAAGDTTPNAFLCIPDYSTGFAIGGSGKWEPSPFNVKGKEYVLNNQNGRWFWTDKGQTAKDPQNLCGGFDKDGFISCKHGDTSVFFNLRTLRFQAVYPYGYVVSDVAIDKLAVTPSYEIGRCSAM